MEALETLTYIGGRFQVSPQSEWSGEYLTQVPGQLGAILHPRR